MYKLLSKIFDRLERGLSPKEKIIIIAMLFVISAFGVVIAVRYYNYIQENPYFCNSCHLMEEAFTAWKLSPHNIIVCQDCHQLKLIEQNKLLMKFVFAARQKKPEPHGAETPWKICTNCHWDEASQGSLTISKQMGHAGHLIMKNLACVDCHSRAVHSFRPDEQACKRCHEDKEIHGIGNNKVSCLMCHPFSPKKQNPMPSREICFRCHRKSPKLVFSKQAPMSRLDCFECHKPHNCVNRPTNKDCLRCHTNTVLVKKSAAHKATKRCTTCHPAHRWTAQ